MLTEQEKNKAKNYISPYEIKMKERLDALDELGLMRTFLELLDTEEESDSGRVFRPNYISSCRVLDSMEMGEILKRLRVLLKEEHIDE